MLFSLSFPAAQQKIFLKKFDVTSLKLNNSLEVHITNPLVPFTIFSSNEIFLSSNGIFVIWKTPSIKWQHELINGNALINEP